MMVRTTCPACDIEVDLATESILLLFGDEDEEGTYAFVCPVCDSLQDKAADKKLAMLLMAAGVPWE